MNTERHLSPSPGTPPPDTGLGDRPGAPASSRTTPVVEGDGAPRLPHEHDESSDSQTSPARPDMEQARDDLGRGLVDTDRGPVMDQVYEQQVRPEGGETRDRGAPDKRRR